MKLTECSLNLAFKHNKDMNLKALFLFVLVGCSMAGLTQKEDYYQEDYFRYRTHVYDSSIHSLDLHKAEIPLSMPLVDISDLKQKLVLSFDDFDDKVKDYQYTFIHCSALWEPSEIRKAEYIRGFENDYIENYRFSYNTIQPYIHYELRFPQEDMMPTLTGNYLIVVYPEGQPEKPALTARFKIFRKQVSISADIKQATRPQFMHTHHEVDFTIRPGDLYIANPSRNIKVIIQQNERQDNKIIDIKPLNVTQNKLEYNYEKENLFEGGNEFRHFDMKSFRYQSEEVRKINVFGDENHVYLYPDSPRRFKAYTFEQDINGKRLIKTTEYDDTDIEADYARVHFELPYKNPLIDGGIYILGELTNWELNEEARMSYNYRKKAYETELYLKQGYYNYMYAFLKNGEQEASLKRIENTFSEAENFYTIFVYYRHPGTLYDQLVGMEKFSSADN